MLNHITYADVDEFVAREVAPHVAGGFDAAVSAFCDLVWAGVVTPVGSGARWSDWLDPAAQERALERVVGCRAALAA